jgi:putative ABC transport system permease protein
VTTPLAWFQLVHERFRLWVAVAGIGFADILMFMQLGFRDALFESATIVQRKLNADLIVANSQIVSFYGEKTFSRHILYQALSIRAVKTVSPFYLSIGEWKNPQTGQSRQLAIFGINPNQLAFNTSDIAENINAIKKPNVVLFDSSSRPEFGNIAADYRASRRVETELNRQQVQVGGLYSFGTSFATDGSVIVSDQNFLRLQPERDKDNINFGLITLKSGSDLVLVQKQLEAKLPKGVKVFTREEFMELEKRYWATSTPIGFIFTLGTIIGFVVGSVIVYQILYADVSAHLSEYATLKAMGYRQRYLLLIVLQESLILAMLGYIPALPTSMWLYGISREATQLPIAMNFTRPLIVFGLTAIMCSVAALFAVGRLKDADPSDIF